MGKVRRGAHERAAMAAMESSERKDGGLAARLQERKERALKIFTALQSVEPHERLVAATAIAGLFEGGTAEEHLDTATKIVGAGGLPVLLGRLFDADVRVRCHVAGGLRNLALCGNIKTMNSLVSSGTIAAFGRAIGETLDFAAAPGSSGDHIAVSHHATMLCELLALMNLLAECVEAAVVAMVPDVCILLWRILQTTDASGDGREVVLTGLARVRVAAAKLLHTLSEHNAELCTMLRTSTDFKAFLLSIAGDGHTEDPLVKAHIIGTIANVFILQTGADATDATPEEAEMACSVVMPFLSSVIGWDPLAAMDDVFTQLNDARTKFMHVGEISDSSHAAEEFLARVRKERLAAKMRARHESAAGGEKHGASKADSDDEEDDAAGSSAHAALAESDGTVLPEVAAALATVNARKAAISDARAARLAYAAARRSWFTSAHCATLALEILANLASGTDEVNAEGGDDSDGEVESDLHNDNTDVALHQLLTSGIAAGVGSLIYKIVSALRISVSEITEDSDLNLRYFASTSKRFRAATAVTLCGVADRASAVICNISTSLYRRLQAPALGDAAAQLPVLWEALLSLTNDATRLDVSAVSATHSVFLAPSQYTFPGIDTVAYTHIDAVIDGEQNEDEEEDDDAEVEDAGRKDISAATSTLRLSRALLTLRQPLGLEYGDEQVPETALNSLMGDDSVAAASSSGAEAGGQATCTDLAGLIVIADQVLCSCLRVLTIPNMVSALAALAKCMKNSGSGLPGLSNEVLAAVAHICNAGPVAPMAATPGTQLHAWAVQPGVMRQNRLATTHALLVLGAAASPITGEHYAVDPSVHEHIAALLASILSAEASFETTLAAVDSLIDIYSDEVHDDAFARLGLLKQLSDSLTRLQQQLSEVRAARKRQDPVVMAQYSRSDIMHAKEVLTNLANFIDYKAANLRPA